MHRNAQICNSLPDPLKALKTLFLSAISLCLLTSQVNGQVKGEIQPQGQSQGQVQTTAPIPKIPIKRSKRYVLFPVIVKSPEYLWGAGAAGTYFFKLKNDSDSRTSNIKAVTFATLRKQLVFASESNIYFPSEKYILHTILSASRFPDRFWGLGNTTSEGALERYAISQVDIYPSLLRKVYSDLFVGIGYEYQNVFDFTFDNPDGQSLFESEDIQGRHGGKISGSSFILTWDSRNNAFSPTKGFYAQYVFGAYRDYMGSDFNFTIQNWDVRKYFTLYKDHVLAMQFNMIVTDGNVPIRQLSNIGSNSYMRGYYEGRYTDHDMIAVQAEYRSPIIWRRIGAVAFVGTGKVGSQISELVDFRSLKPSFGIGLRYSLKPSERLNLRVDAGFGKKSQGTYINMGEAF
jgi:outer membrane protein assembly factor BamA